MESRNASGFKTFDNVAPSGMAFAQLHRYKPGISFDLGKKAKIENGRYQLRRVRMTEFR